MSPARPWRQDRTRRAGGPPSTGSPFDGNGLSGSDAGWEDIDRSNAAVPPPSTGRRRRTRAQRNASRSRANLFLAVLDVGGVFSLVSELVLDRWHRVAHARDAREWRAPAAPSLIEADEPRSAGRLGPSATGWEDIELRPRGASRASSGRPGRNRDRARGPILIGSAIAATAGLALLLPASPISLIDRGGPELTAAPEVPAVDEESSGADESDTAGSLEPTAGEGGGVVADAAPEPPAPPAPPPAVSGPSRGGADALFDPPADRASFIERVRSQTVTIYCQAGQSQGSGWPFDPVSLGAPANPTGTLIITNGHVTDRCRNVTVEQGGRSYFGQVIGTDFPNRGFENDFAVIQIDERLATLPVARDFAVGHWVIASGSPSGVVQTVTTGIISNDRDGLIWTDAAISPGSSGGPLLNSDGSVIGVNTWGLVEAPNIGIALPVSRLCDRLFRCS